MLFKDFTVNENMNLNVRGGGKVVDYFLNASIFNENGILKKPAESKFNTNINSQKYLFQANVGAQLTRTTRVSLKMNTQLLFWHRPVEEVKDLFYYTMRANPVAFPAIYPKGSVDDLDDPIFGNAPSWDGSSTDINPYALLSRGYGQRHTQYITTTFSVDQDLDFVTKGLKVRGMVSFYNKTYAATYRSFSPYYYEMTDYTDNGDGVIDANDRTSLGYPTVPEIMYGFGASVNYKRWDFSFFFQGPARVSLRMYDMHPFRDNQYSGFNMTQYVADDHWSEADPNPNAAYPRLDYRYNANNTQTSSFWIKNGSYLRLKSVELGFTYKSLRAYLAGTNLFIISPFKYWDPEMGSGNGLKYPLQRVVKLGLQYNF